MLMQTISASDLFRLKGSNPLTSKSAKVAARYMQIYSSQNKSNQSYSKLGEALSITEISGHEKIYMNAEQVRAFDKSLLKVGGLIAKGRLVGS